MANGVVSTTESRSVTVRNENGCNSYKLCSRRNNAAQHMENRYINIATDFGQAILLALDSEIQNEEYLGATNQDQQTRPTNFTLTSLHIGVDGLSLNGQGMFWRLLLTDSDVDSLGGHLNTSRHSDEWACSVLSTTVVGAILS